MIPNPRFANRLTFAPGWKLTLFVLFFLPLLVSLGLWQLEREQVKLDMQSNFEARRNEAPQPLETLEAPDEALAYSRVRVSGEFDNGRSFLLDNRIHNGQVGYEVISPFYFKVASGAFKGAAGADSEAAEGSVVALVNRGWLPQGRSRANLPEIPPVAGPVSIIATVHVPEGEAFRLGADAESSQWPRVVQSAGIESLAESFEAPVFPFELRLFRGQPGALTPNWETVNMMPEKHRAYAVQWFLMAAVLMAMYLYVGFRHASGRDDNDPDSEDDHTN